MSASDMPHAYAIWSEPITLPPDAQFILIAGTHSGAGCSTLAAQLVYIYPGRQFLDAGILRLPVQRHLPASLSSPPYDPAPDLIILLHHPGDGAAMLRPFLEELAMLFGPAGPDIWLRHKQASRDLAAEIDQLSATLEMLIKTASDQEIS